MDPEAFPAVSSDQLWSCSSITSLKYLEFSPLSVSTDPTREKRASMSISILVMWASWSTPRFLFQSSQPRALCWWGEKAETLKATRLKKQKQNQPHIKKKKKEGEMKQDKMLNPK